MRAHIGVAVTPLGTSVGHGIKSVHLAEQTSPGTPVDTGTERIGHKERKADDKFR